MRSHVKTTSALPDPATVTSGDLIYVAETGHHYAKNSDGDLQDLGLLSDVLTAQLAAEQLRAQAAEGGGGGGSAALSKGAYFFGGSATWGKETGVGEDYLFNYGTNVYFMRFVLPFAIVVTRTNFVPSVDGSSNYAFGLYDKDGNLVLSHKRTSAQDGIQNIDAGPVTLPAGVYDFAWGSDGNASMSSIGLEIDPQQSYLSNNVSCGIANGVYNTTTHALPAVLGGLKTPIAFKAVPYVMFMSAD